MNSLTFYSWIHHKRLSLVRLEILNQRLLQVWWIMIEGMCGTVLECHQQVQAQTMETVYSMLRALAIIPGPQFQILVMCHQLFPMLTRYVGRRDYVCPLSSGDVHQVGMSIGEWGCPSLPFDAFKC